MEDAEQNHPHVLARRPPSPFDSVAFTARLQNHNNHNHKRFSVSSDSDLRFHSSPLAEPSSQPESSHHASARAHVPSAKRISTSARPTLPLNGLPSAPASPPTPAPSPTPFQRAPSWAPVSENEEAFIRDARAQFAALSLTNSERFLSEILNMCSSQQLSFVKRFVSPRLKKDPFEHLPDELCLKVSVLIHPRKGTRRLLTVHRFSACWTNRASSRGHHECLIGGTSLSTTIWSGKRCAVSTRTEPPAHHRTV